MTDTRTGGGIVKVPATTTKPARWRIRVDVGIKPDGSRRQESRTFATKKQAEAWRDQVRTTVRDGQYTPRDRTTFGTYATAWLSGRRDLRPSSRRVYGIYLAPFVASLGGRTLQSIERADLDAVVTDRLVTGGRHGDGTAPQTIARALTTVAAVFDAAMAEGLVPRNPARTVVKPKAQRQERPAWSADDLRRFVAASHGKPAEPLARLLALGLRRGEVLGLQWEDVDLDAGTLTIRRTRGIVGTTMTVGDPKTETSKRSLPLPEDLVPVLRRHRANSAAVHLRLGVTFDASTYVITTEAAEPLHPDALTRRIKALMRAAEVPDIPVHSIRHSSVSAMLGAGVPLHVVARWHGHSPAVMMRTYAHADSDALAVAAAATVHTLAGAV